VDTDQSSDGTLGVIGSNFRVCDADSDSVIDADCAITDGASYSHFLPSFSINAEVVEDLFVRFAASTTISRARLDQMKASGFVKFDLNDQFITLRDEDVLAGAGSPWSKEAGNAQLRPLESNNYDISLEKYFVEGFHNRVLDVDVTNSQNGIFYPAGTNVFPPSLGQFSFFEDGLEGSVSGLELTANIPMSILSDTLDGFGVVASATFIDAEVDDGSSIPGQSDQITSLVAYYENEGFEFRVAMTDRDEYTTYERGGSNKITEATRDGTQVVDAQISYDFENSGIEHLEGLRVSFQATNLLDDADQVSRDDNGIVTTRREFGPSYMVNFNYSFY
jgi:iron complex outermembrane receptor protein